MSSRRSRNGGTSIDKHVDAVVKIVTKTTVSHHRAQVAIRRGNHAHVNADLMRTTDAPIFRS